MIYDETIREPKICGIFGIKKLHFVILEYVPCRFFKTGIFLFFHFFNLMRV